MTPDIAPRRRNRPPSAPPTLEDLEGYLVGVRRRVAEQDAGTRTALTPGVDQAEAALRSGDLTEADRILRALDERLDALTPEVEMTDRPRGLVAFRTVGDPGVPLGREEDPIANRLLLVGRLATLRDSRGAEVARALGLLREAEHAYAAGDRPLARRKVDQAHALLEADPPGPSDGRTP